MVLIHHQLFNLCFPLAVQQCGGAMLGPSSNTSGGVRPTQDFTSEETFCMAGLELAGPVTVSLFYF